MKQKNSRTITVVLAITTGLFVMLSGYSDNPTLRILRGHFLHWAVLLFGLLLFFAILDFVVARVRNIGTSTGSVVNNLICFASFIAILVLGLFEGFEGPRFLELTFNIQSAVEASLAGLICLALICALFRFPRWKKNRMTVAFTISLLVFLMLYSGLLNYIPLPDFIINVLDLVSSIPLGGLYGLLMGLALGALVSGIRFVFLGEHPYKERK